MAESNTPMMGERAASLIELLRLVPKNGVHVYEHHATHHQNVPYGKHCHNAADRIEQLERLLAAANERADNLAKSERHTKAVLRTMENDLRSQLTKAEQSLASAQQAAFAEIKKAIRKRQEERFAENGITEPDTGAQYYGGRDKDILNARDEEGDDIIEIIERAASLPPTHVFVPKEINREIHRNLLDVWNDCMMNAETLEMTWPKLVKALAAHGGGGE